MEKQPDYYKKTTSLKRCMFCMMIPLVILIGSLSSCNNNPVKKDVEPTALTVYDSLKYGRFILNRAAIEASPQLMAPPGTPHKIIILKLKFDNLVQDTFNIDLLAYPAKNHAHHGQILSPIMLTRQDTGRIRLPRRLILGNIYVDWEFIKNGVSNPGPGGGFKPEFAYLKFTPIDRTVGISAWDGHLRYKVTAHSSDGTQIFPLGGGAGDGSKPSPPAPPPS